MAVLIKKRLTIGGLYIKKYFLIFIKKYYIIYIEKLKKNHSIGTFSAIKGLRV